jgi:hypothetical protein
MGRVATGAVAALAAGSLMVSAAFGAGMKNQSWQAVAGTFKSNTAAQKAITKLNGKGDTGYTVETDNAKKGEKYEVEKSFGSQKAAKTAVKKLRADGFKHAKVENEKTEKSA